MSSCTQEKAQFKEESVNLSRVRSLATAINMLKRDVLSRLDPQNSNPNTRMEGEFNTLNAFSFNDKNGLAAVYAINYSLNGKTFFNVLSADTHLQPFLAYGDNSLDKDNLPPAFMAWAATHVLAAETARATVPEPCPDESSVGGGDLPTADDHGDFDGCAPCACKWTQGNSCDPFDDFPTGGSAYCELYNLANQGINEVGPLMSSEWNQSCFYNKQLAPCTGDYDLNCDRELTGCVATAVGQVMNYHEFPASIPWTNILDDYNNTSIPPTVTQIDDVSNLLLNVGTALGTSYSCTGSSADICANNNVVNVFNIYGYTANSCIAYPFEPTVKTNIDAGLPVIIEAEYLVNGHTKHAWVCDGYADRIFCRYDCENGTTFASMEFFHMNWGWGYNTNTGSNASGYFLFAGASSNGINNLKMIGDIQH